MPAPLRIGLVADSHVGRRGQLWPQVFAAFAGVDAILHAGDVFSPQLLDELEAIAPLTVVRGNGDIGSDDARFQEECVVRFGGVRVALLHDFPSPARRGTAFVQAQAAKRFPGAEVLVCGHTHIEEAHALDGLLWANPGSPTLPRNKSLRLGTIGFLTIADGAASVELCQLTAAGHATLQRIPGATDCRR